MRILVCFQVWLLAATFAVAQSKTDGPMNAHAGGPSIDTKKLEGVAPHIVLTDMFAAIEKQWFPQAYAQRTLLDYRADLSAELPNAPMVVDGEHVSAGEPVDFDINIDGEAAPSGEHAMRMTGSLGAVTVTQNKRRTLVTSEDFKSFSDTPARTREQGANLTNWRSYFLSHLGAMRGAILEGGNFRSMYQGSGTYQGREVDIVTVYKPTGALVTKGKRPPINLRKLWTFWQDGAYEIWVYRVSKLPAVVFYSNPDDNIFANFTIGYDKEWLPKRISYINNSANQEGTGDITLNFDRERLLTGLALKYDGRKGVSLQFNANLAFLTADGKDPFRAVPPLGFRKLNRDHLKMMIMTQISGGILKLKKNGINLRNFKF